MESMYLFLYIVCLLKSKVHRSVVPITDIKDCVIAVLAGSPDDEEDGAVHQECCQCSGAVI